MHATISNLLLEDHMDIIQVGSIIILREVTVISQIGSKSGINPKDSFYLNITPNVISTIYSGDEKGKIKTTNFSRLTKSEILNLKKISTFDLTQKVVVEEAETESKDNSEMNGLFETFLDSPSTKNLASSKFLGNSKNPSFKSPISSNFSDNSPRLNNNYSFSRQKLNSPGFAVNKSNNYNSPVNKFNNNNNFKPSSNNNVSNNYNKPQIKVNNSIHSPSVPSTSASSSNTNISNKTNDIKQICNSNKKSFIKMSNEEEFNNILDGVDVDSLFDDF